MKIFGIIYRATLKIDGRKYYGQTTKTLQERMNKHLRDKDSSYFHNSLRKYGKDNFIFEIVEECRSREELDEREEYWIVLDDTINRDKGFNLIKGAMDNPMNYEEFRKKVSESKMREKNPRWRYIFSEEEKQILSEKFSGENNPFAGRKHTEESKKKMSDFKKGKNYGIIGARHPAYGKKRSVESKNKQIELSDMITFN